MGYYSFKSGSSYTKWKHTQILIFVDWFLFSQKDIAKVRTEIEKHLKNTSDNTIGTDQNNGIFEHPSNLSNSSPNLEKTEVLNNGNDNNGDKVGKS